MGKKRQAKQESATKEGICWGSGWIAASGMYICIVLLQTVRVTAARIPVTKPYKVAYFSTVSQVQQESIEESEVELELSEDDAILDCIEVEF